MLNFFKKEKNKKPEENIRAHLFVSGNVQGVFFRETARKKAAGEGVTGWAKNLRDGRVEAVFEGKESKVRKMVDWARSGPIWAKIEALDVVWEDYKNEFKEFEVKYDL
ncbi:MAG: acylphosphatase [Candidatus Portnoybacteria bacterium]